MQRGVLFLALVIPWVGSTARPPLTFETLIRSLVGSMPQDATGEAYDATTLLLQALCSRVQRDQREENMMRSTRGEALLPKLERVFTMRQSAIPHRCPQALSDQTELISVLSIFVTVFFKTGSRMITQLTKKRGFAPIDEYLASNPRADPLAVRSS